MRERERKFERDTFWSWIGQHLDLFTSSPSIAWWPKTGLCRNFCQFQSNFNFLTFNNTLKYFSQPKKASYKCKPFTDSFKCKKLRASLSLLSQHTASSKAALSATQLLIYFHHQVLKKDNSHSYYFQVCIFLSFTIWVFHIPQASTFRGKLLLIDNTYPV